MKRLMVIYFLLSPMILTAQVIKFNIQGTVKHTEHAKFAYLSTLSQQIPISSPKIFMVTPIVNGKFEFNNTFDLEGKDYQHACVFVDERGNISKEELASKFRLLVWVTDRENNLRHIVLENMNLNAEEPDQMKVSKVVAGGILTKQLGEINVTISEGDRKLIAFIKKYPDSPISFDQVKSITEDITVSNRDRIESIYGSPVELYPLLSERLKNSKKGLALKKKISEKYKL